MIASPHLLRTVAVSSVAALLVGWMVTFDPAAPPADAAGQLPADAETFLVSRTDAGASTDPYVTPDGQKVAFVSNADDLGTIDTNGVAHVFLSTAIQGKADPFTGTAELVSAPDPSFGVEAANDASTQPAMSADGRYVVFTSEATNLVTEASAPNVRQVYVRDMQLGTTVRVEGAGVPDGPSYDADISDDGRFVVFTSDATNLPAGDVNSVPDTNGAADTFIADLDPDRNGHHDSVAITRLLQDLSLPGGTAQARISGNGAYVLFTARVDLIEFGQPIGSFTRPHLFRADLGARGAAFRVATGAHDGAIDATGDVVAYIDDSICGDPSVMAASIANNDVVSRVAVGRPGSITDVGEVFAPAISADGQLVAFPTTQPVFAGNANLPALTQPVIRVQQVISWFDTGGDFQCAPNSGLWYDAMDGDAVSLSASGRTIVTSGDSAQSAAAASVSAIDTHVHDGISVSNTLGSLLAPGFVTTIEIADIPLADLPDYSAALANAPIYRLPIYRLPIYRLPIYRLPIYRLMVDEAPIYRLPIYRLPIYRLPIYRLDIPGGWQELLQDTPFAELPEQNITLSQVLEWAADTIANPPADKPKALPAAQRIQTLALGDLDLTGSGLDSLSLASMILGAAPVVQLPAGDAAATEARWQDLLDAQGIHLDVDADTVLAELDSAGLDIGRSGVESVPLNDLAGLPTLLNTLPLKGLIYRDTPLGALDISTLDDDTRVALFGEDAVAGSLEFHVKALPADANPTVADLAAGTPDSVTLGTLLFSMVDAESYPWEQIDPGSVDPRAIMGGTPGDNCTTWTRCQAYTEFQFTFDPGPGEPTEFAAPVASVELPAGTTQDGPTLAGGSGPRDSWRDTSAYTGPEQHDGTLQRFPLADMPGGTVISFEMRYSVTANPAEKPISTGTLTSGDLTAEDSVANEVHDDLTLLRRDNLDNNRVDGVWVTGNPTTLRDGLISYDMISPQWLDDQGAEGGLQIGPADDEDWYLVDPPTRDQRLIVSTNATDGQISMAMYSADAAGTPLGAGDATEAPGTAITEQQSSAADDPGEAGADAAAPVAGHTLIDQAVVGGDGVAEIQTSSTDAAAGQQLLVRVTSGNGVPTTGLYSIRAHYVDEPPEQSCPDFTAPAQAKPGVVGKSDAVTTTTNTVYLFDAKRYGDLYGADAATSVIDALHSMTGEGEVGAGTVQGAVLSIDSNTDVATARGLLDANPCSTSLRADLTEAINTYVKAAIGNERSHISSIVIVGGDDVVPFAPVAQHTSQFNEAKHAAELKLPHPLAGGDCPTVETGQDDSCATPLSSAAATNHILTDDPYGLAKAYRSLGGFLYVPTVAVGRLIDTPDQILGAIARFNAADGLLAADSSISGGYGAWSELPGIVTDNLDWRDTARGTILTEPWTKSTVDDAVFNATKSPRVVSINTHADEQLMLPGITGAESGAATPDALLTAKGRTGKAALNGALVFMIGCHAGNNLPTSYYGDVADWADVFSSAGGYVGNTGYGLANSTATALSERLLGLYAGWIGAKIGTTKVSSAGALTYAKQSYLGGLGLYSGYDEKAMMEAVYYGLPMYAFNGPTQDAPLPTIPGGMSQIAPNADGVLTASLNLSDFEVKPGGDAAKGTYLTVNGQEPLAVAGQPVLPKIVSQLRAEENGKPPRGALITGLTSTLEKTKKPAIADATIGTGAPGLPAGSAFPSSLAAISSQLTPNGPVNLLVVTPARVEVGRDGAGRTEMFSSLDLEVLYSDAADTTPPIIKATEVYPDSTFRATVDGTGSEVKRAVLLIQRADSPAWEKFELTSDDKVTWKSPPLGSEPYRWILQAVDAGANVATESARGRIAVAHAPAPTKVEVGEDAELRVGDRLLRTALIEGVDADTAVTGSFKVLRADGSAIDSGLAVVNTGDDGKLHATIDHLISAIGSFTVELKVCSTGGCVSDTFALTVPPDNTAPTSTARITSSTPLVLPTSTLTALITTEDRDDDEVFSTPEWFRNGVAIPGSAGSTTLDLAAVGAAGGALVSGEVIAVEVRTSDGEVLGSTARAEVVVGGLPDVPALPDIIATATNDDGKYTEGWSRSAVRVHFTCTSGVAVLTCSPDEEITGDTKFEGRTIFGTVTDALGNTKSTSILVKVDVTAPALHPSVTPDTVLVGDPAPTADAGATDGASRVVSQSCTAPDTRTAGVKKVTCTATDAAGNTAPDATASYTVTAPAPAAPTITATAKVGSATYVEGTWSRGPTTVTFTCRSGVLVLSCSPPVTTSKDTGPAGVVVTGRVIDALGRTTTVPFLVKVDRTPPKLAPTVTPSTIPLGGTVVANANATDALSGIASQSCDAPQTSTLGRKTVTCRATDVAGNTATAAASYTVTAPVRAAPTITATAKVGAATYAEGTWSQGPVKVTFTCRSGVLVLYCSPPVTTSKDTGPAGVVVTGRVIDVLGRTTTVPFVVKVDRTPPKLAPTVTPSTIPLGGTVVVKANATDALSGIATQSCDAPQTSTLGRKTVTCRATDVAGNTATATATYTVVRPR